MLPPLHRSIEEAGFNSLPSIQTLLYDGWLIRLAGGGPKRANSVNVLTASAIPFAQKIRYCEQLFQQQGLPLTFRLTDHPQNLELDACLEREGLQRIDDSLVLVKQLDHPTASTALELHQSDAETWFSQMMLLDQGSPERKQKHVELLKRLALPAVYGGMQTGEGHAAIGLAVIDGDYAGIFDINTNPVLRRRGHARALMTGLLDEARQHGARTAYLQVTASNMPAIGLYESLGFVPAYRYWYRCSAA
ncbi:MAG: GNAT family N-acetyltransferase [Pseudomonadota bacterium]